MRHKWNHKIKGWGFEEMTCDRCGLKKINRMERNHHWVEWQQKNGIYIESDKTPPCPELEGEQ